MSRDGHTGAAPSLLILCRESVNLLRHTGSGTEVCCPLRLHLSPELKTSGVDLRYPPIGQPVSGPPRPHHVPLEELGLVARQHLLRVAPHRDLQVPAVLHPARVPCKVILRECSLLGGAGHGRCPAALPPWPARNSPLTDPQYQPPKTYPMSPQCLCGLSIPSSSLNTAK